VKTPINMYLVLRLRIRGSLLQFPCLGVGHKRTGATFLIKIRDPIPGRGNDRHSLRHCAQMGSGAYPASYRVGTACSYLGDKAAGA
jgi:hypothetical protein